MCARGQFLLVPKAGKWEGRNAAHALAKNGRVVSTCALPILACFPFYNQVKAVNNARACRGMSACLRSAEPKLIEPILAPSRSTRAFLSYSQGYFERCQWYNVPYFSNLMVLVTRANLLLASKKPNGGM